MERTGDTQTTIHSGVGGAFSQTFGIPTHLRGSDRIAIGIEFFHEFPYTS